MLTPVIRPRDQLPSYEEFCDMDSNQICALDITPEEIVFLFEEECARRGINVGALVLEEMERHQGDFD